MPSRVLIISHDIVGPRMAGPGMRYQALAEVVAQHCSTTLAVPQSSELFAGSVPMHIYRREEWSSISKWAEWADVIVAPGDTLADFAALRDWDRPLVIDGYDPHTAENLMLTQSWPISERIASYHKHLELLTYQCLASDYIICAGEVQRNWWLGLLEAHGRVNPYTFDEDPSLRRLIDIVPFGLPPTPFSGDNTWNPPGGVSPQDRVLLWGGGLWDWLDPLTAIRAMPRVLKQRPNTKLLFPGTRHPNPGVPVMRRVAEAQQLVQSLGLSAHVLFGDWVPREEWPNYLARADVGLSLHPDTLETRLAFRSRLLDYIWAGLPMVVTRGDETSTLVAKYHLGAVVDYANHEEVADAIEELLARPKEVLQEGFVQARHDLNWERAAAPLVEFCLHPRCAPDKIARGDKLGGPFCMEKIHRLTEERNALQDLVKRYERGRFMRFTRWGQQVWQKLSKNNR